MPDEKVFPVPLSVEIRSNGRCAVLLTDFVYDDGERVVVPSGMVTDWSSIPRFFWRVLAPWEYPEAGLVHDWLYRHPGGRQRAACDRIYRDILAGLGCPIWKRLAAWSAVRIFGARHFDRDEIPDACMEVRNDVA